MKSLTAYPSEQEPLGVFRIFAQPPGGYQREITRLRGRRKEASQLMPRVHRVSSLLKRWLLGTHQGAVAPRHLPLPG